MNDPTDNDSATLDPRTNAQAIIDTAMASCETERLADHVAGITVPAGADYRVIDLEQYLELPTSKRGVYLPADVDSFVQYVKRHHDKERTTIWVHPESGHIAAILDDVSPDAPAWRRHRVELRLRMTSEWRYWLEQNNRMMSQEDFAEHIEGGLTEIHEPDAAVMLEIAQTFHATTHAQFRSSTRLHSGEQRLQYDEEVKAAAGTAGDLTVPTTLKLAISPFVGEEPYAVAARIRFRLNAGRLTLGYRLDRPEAVVRDSLDKVAERLTLEFPHTYMGDPPTGEQ